MVEYECEMKLSQLTERGSRRLALAGNRVGAKDVFVDRLGMLSVMGEECPFLIFP